MQKCHSAALMSLAIGIVGCNSTVPLKPADSAGTAKTTATSDAVTDIPLDKLIPPAQWGAPFASGGTELALEQRGMTVVEGKQAVSYGFVASGYPKEKNYMVWVRMLTGKTVMLDKLRVEPNGALMSERGMPLSKETFNFYSLHRGEPVDFALVSEDRAVQAFARVVPFPLQAMGDKGCSLKLEMLAPGGTQFGIVGNGFKPNEDVVTTSRVDEQSKQQKLKASNSGAFINVVDSRKTTKSGGIATYLATGKSCKVKLHYEWGTAVKNL